MTSSDPSLATKLASFEDVAGRPRLGLVAKRRYRLHHGRLRPDERASDIVVEPVGGRRGGAVVVERESDLDDLDKPMTDVLLVGTAHAHGVARELEVGFRLGPIRRAMTVHGARVITLDTAGRPAFSQAEPFERAPIDWSEAYGGRDRHAERRLFPRDPKQKVTPPFTAEQLRFAFAIAYVRNRGGRGYYVDGDRERLVGARAPSLSDPGDPVRPERILCRDPMDWVDRPLPAGFGPIDALTFPRCVWARLTPDRGRSEAIPLEVARGYVTRDELGFLERAPLGQVDPRALQCAPPGQVVPALRGDEPVELHHLDPAAPHVSFSLPRHRPRLTLEPPNTRRYELEARISTVLLEPDARAVTITWTGSMPVAAPYPDGMCAEMPHSVTFA